MQHRDLGRVVCGFLLAGIIAGCGLAEVRTAERLAAQGDWDGATASYRTALRKDPFNDDLRAALDVARAKAAEIHYVEGKRFLTDHQLAEALQEFNLALSLDPSRIEHQTAVTEALRLKDAREVLQTADKLRDLGRLEEALAAYERAVELDPGLTAALQAITALVQQQRADHILGKTGQPITLRFQNVKLKEVFEILARTAGINVIFDKEFRDEPISIFIKDIPFSDALNLILSTNNLFSRRIGPDTLLIIPNTKQKQDQYQDLMIRTFYLSNAKAKELVNLLRTMLDTKRVYVNEPLNAVVLREQPDKLRLAERIILANDRRESEVVFDVEVLEVNRTKSEKLGINYAKTAGVGALPTGVAGALAAVAQQFTYRQLTSIGSDSYVFSVPTTAILDFFKQESDAKTLAAPKVRVANNRKASINIGDKQPILLSTTNVLPGQAATGAVPTTSTVTSIEFKDTGVKLSIEPTIHLINEVTLKLNIEVTRIGDRVTLQDSPRIEQFRFGTRTAETTLNLKDGETVVLAGLIQDEERKTRVTVPWLGDIPVLGNLFSSTTTDIVSTEVILTLSPHVVRNVTMPAVEGQAFWSGTELTYATTPLYSTVAVSYASNKAGERSSLRLPAETVGAPAADSVPAHPIPDAPAVVITVGTPCLQPSELGAFVGQEFWVELNTQGLTGLTQSTVMLIYDPTVLEFKRAEAGALLPGDGNSGSGIIPGPPQTGRVALHLQRSGIPPSGNGALSRVLFLARSPGDSVVDILSSPRSGHWTRVGHGLIHVR